MDTPICSFLEKYLASGTVRLHMPGHKGSAVTGPEPWDITEIRGADELFHPNGIIRSSEENAAHLFGSGRTLYSTEGSSLCVRAMVYLALAQARAEGRPTLILAGRNVHKSFLSAAALLDAQVEWLWPENPDSLLSCLVTPEGLETALSRLPAPPAAVYVTSPDYLGHMLDIGGLKAVCLRHSVPLLVDNAHGAYLRFLREDMHPLRYGADLCCDSAHKTLPALTGGAYLHIGKNAPASYFENARRAMELFATSSPSYLILRSLDACNALLAGAFPEQLQKLAARAEGLKTHLSALGYPVIGDEPAKLTLAPKAYGYTGDRLHGILRQNGMECEFSDPDHLTAMLSPCLGEEALERLESVLSAVTPGAPISARPPRAPRPRRAFTLREAMLSPSEELPIEKAVGRAISDSALHCPPCVPVLAWGEIADEDALGCYQYYGMKTCRVIK
ncbi:MAG: amino acid decarboxylase [Clostridia bacterium]|nr:amino acid decarboxylase [Clostridia bacterium]